MPCFVSIDRMTGLFNHESAFNHLQNQISLADETGRPLSLIIMDIDDFKRVNDQHGHLFGDEVICKVSRAIVHAVKMTDLVGRYGGEEFMVIMPDTNEIEARQTAAAIQQAISEIHFQTTLKVTFSGGISEYRGGTINELISLTDNKLYLAKRRGKNHFLSSLDLPANLDRLRTDPNGNIGKYIS